MPIKKYFTVKYLAVKNIFYCTDATYDYAVPMPVPSVSSDQDSVFSKSSSRGSAKVRHKSIYYNRI